MALAIMPHVTRRSHCYVIMTAQFFAPIGNNLRGLDCDITQVINKHYNPLALTAMWVNCGSSKFSYIVLVTSNKLYFHFKLAEMNNSYACLNFMHAS